MLANTLATAAGDLVAATARSAVDHSRHHLPLGVTATERSIQLDEQLLADDRKWRTVSRSADFDEPYPARIPPDTPD